jgi:hypothetical protein
MRYQGGKSRIAKPIAQIIMQAAGGDCFVSLFCGSCAVESKRLLADLGHTVFVSEQEAPPDIQCIWEKPFTRTLDRNKGNQFTVTEKLFYLPPRRYTQHENGQSGILPE